jgi:hypothetical protein
MHLPGLPLSAIALTILTRRSSAGSPFLFSSRAALIVSDAEPGQAWVAAFFKDAGVRR